MTFRIITLWFAAMCASAPMSATERCALKVVAVDGDGRRVVTPYPVRLIDKTGKTVASTSLSGGEARICDFGFGRYSLFVGSPGRCGSVEVQQIRYLWSEEQEFRLVINVCKGEGDGITNGCEVLLRVRDEQGNPIAFPRLDFKTNVVVQGLRTGLIIIGLGLGSREAVNISVDGYISQRVDLECKNYRSIEQYINLRAVSRK